jgi:hypothetical protein
VASISFASTAKIDPTLEGGLALSELVRTRFTLELKALFGEGFRSIGARLMVETIGRQSFDALPENH